MPAMPVYVIMSSVSSLPTRAVNLDYQTLDAFNVSITATPTSTAGGTNSYFMETTRQDQQYLSAIGSTIAVTWQFDPTWGASGGTSSAASMTLTSPVAAVRFNSTAISSGSLVFSVLQS